jgi:2-polyprenyl-3-methyl-5-hydroxy-6-metoxy-1,4-benzoquinol methylase
MSSQRCPTCKGQEFEICASNPAHTINYGTVVFSQKIDNALCRTCGQVQNYPQPSEEELGKIYRAMTRNVVEGVVHDYSTLPIESAQYEFVMAHAALPGSPRVLDIGCSLGGFLSLFAQNGARVVGCEPSQADGKVAAARGIEIVPRMFSLADYSPASFDLIALRFVFEHLSDPARMLADLKTLLKPGGMVFIEVPDLAHSFIGLDDFFSFGHTFTFSSETLQQMVEAEGYSVAKLAECNNRDLPRRTFPSLRLLATPDGHVPVLKSHVSRSLELVRSYDDARRALVVAIGTRLEQAGVAQAQRLVIYGAGTHSAELLLAFPWLINSCMAFVDGNRELQGHDYFGRPVLSPSELPVLNAERIIISAREAESEILSYLASIGLAERAIPLYSGER